MQFGQLLSHQHQIQFVSFPFLSLQQRLKNEELYKLAEERRKEAERRKIEEEEEEKNKQDIETEKYLIDEKVI